MIIESNLYRDFERFSVFLREFNTKTDGRYSKEIDSLYSVLNSIWGKLKIEYQYREKLQSYKTQGFNVDEYLNKTYSSYDNMINELNQVFGNINNLIIIGSKFNSMLSRIPMNLRQKLIPLLKTPSRYLEAVSLWNKIQFEIGENKK